MDLETYNRSSGLNKQTYIKLLEQLDAYPEDKLIRVLEFGSGASTRFFIDYKAIYNKNLEITSFEDNINMGYKQHSSDTCLTLHIRNLIECSNSDFDNQITNKIFNKELFHNRIEPSTWRQRNCIYNILDGDMTGIYDIVIIDGCNGNGRNLLYPIIVPYIAADTIILVDDYNSRDNEYDYKFIENIYTFFNLEELYTHTGDDYNYETVGQFMLLKVIDII